MKRFFTYSLLMLLSIAALEGATVSFSLIPPDGRISGRVGENIGWGYSLFNESPTEWFVPTNLSSGTFSIGLPGLLFDFPFLPPGLGVTVPFNWQSFMGLYSLSLPFDAIPGAEDAGAFNLQGEWWSGDPFSGGAFLRAGETLSAEYTAGVTAVPEPASLGLLVLALGAGTPLLLLKAGRNGKKLY
jgi:hypothetical protein